MAENLAPTLDDLLTQADVCARDGNWQETFETLGRAAMLEPSHAGAITGLGTCLIQLGRAAEAVPFFQRVVELAPDSPEAFNNLGVAHALAGELKPAQAAYQKAVECNPDHGPAWKNLALLHLKQGRLDEGVSILAAVVRAHPEDVEALLLLAGCYEEAGDQESARALVLGALKRQPDHPEALAALARLPQAAPDAARLARPDHVRKLAGLKTLVKSPANGRPKPRPAKALAFYGPAEVSYGVRLGLPAAALARHGLRAKAAPAFGPGDLEEYDVFVFSRPQLAPHLLQGVAACARAGKRVIVDLDDDFHNLPADHPGYANVGPGNPASLQALETAIAQADLLTVSTPTLAERYGAFARRVAVVPNGWSRENALWDQPPPRRPTLNIGWAGTRTHQPDVALIRQAVIRFVRETPEAQLVIGGDPGVYEAFAALPESRRLFLPILPYDDYPFLLAHFDILLAPLRDNPFNQAKSDIKLLEAGARRIPWVAAPLPAYREWAVGGLLADCAQPDAWYAALRQLAGDAALRRELGRAGREKSLTREASALTPLWQEVFLG